MSTSTSKTTKSRKPSQTARILESVELLVALHEEQGNSTPSPDSSRVVQQLENLEQKLSEIMEANQKDGSGGDSNESVLECLVQLEQVEKKVNERFDALKDHFDKSIADLSASQTPSIDVNAMDWSRLDAIESNLAEQIEAAISTKMDQQFEQYLELLEGQSNGSPDTQWACKMDALTESIESMKASVAVPSSTSEKVLEDQATWMSQLESVSTRLAELSEKMDRLSDRLESREESSSQAIVENDLSNLADQIQVKLGEQLTEQLSGLVEQSNSQLSEDLSRQLSQTLENRFAKIDLQLEAMESNESTSMTRDSVAEEIRLQSKESVFELKLHLDEALAKGFAEVRNLAAESNKAEPENDTSSFEVPTIAPSDDEDSASHWHRQKKAMLEKYGIDPDYRPLEKDAKVAAAAAEKVIPEVRATAATKLEELHQTINNISQEDSEAIENLKKELNSKLRDAEVELSINRAKLSQQRAELERKQVELEQRAADLERKLASSHDEQGAKRGGIMSRFTRHLGRGKSE